MFKGILPSARRVPSGEFTIVTNLLDEQAKENQPTQPKITHTKGRSVSKAFTNNEKKKKKDTKKSKEAQAAEPEITPQAFDKLLDDLQIPPSLRPKLHGMDDSVKASMIKSSMTMALAPPQNERPAPSTPHASKRIRKAHSIESMSTPNRPTIASLAAQDNDDLPLPNPFSAAQVSAHHSPYISPERKVSGHSRGLSFEAPRLFSKSQVNLASSSNLDLTAGGKGLKDKNPNTKLSPTKFCSILTGTSSLNIDVENLKKLRLMLRNESASWTEEFLRIGGYSAILTRLNEILEVEWREEQHDDQVLHELLRCMKALSTSSIGCAALRSSFPTPYAQLISLIYSDKKPGEVATRQLIIELIHLLFDLYPPSALPSSGTGRPGIGSPYGRREAWESQSTLTTSNLICLPPPYKDFFSLIRSLLLTPAPPPAECPGTPVAHHEFIESLHIPRVYKTYLQEMSDVCRDYFWVFCHPNNTIWVLGETNENSVEKPRAPGGMTGGVEFEAMNYFTTHLKFINAVARCVEALNMPKDHELSAFRFHNDLFLSGLERILLVSRKASTTYYPTLHLELARYIAAAIRAGYELPYTVARLIGLPPAPHAKNPPGAVNSVPAGNGSGRNTPRHAPGAPGTPTKQRRMGPGVPPALPSPKKVEAMRFD